MTSRSGRRAPHLTEASAVIPAADPDAAATAAAAGSPSAVAGSSEPHWARGGLHNGHELFSEAFGLLVALFLRHEALAAQRVPSPCAAAAAAAAASFSDPHICYYSPPSETART